MRDYQCPRARLKSDRAVKQKALPENVLTARHAERRLWFLPKLTGRQIFWIKHEAKSRGSGAWILTVIYTVDKLPGQLQGRGGEAHRRIKTLND